MNKLFLPLSRMIKIASFISVLIFFSSAVLSQNDIWNEKQCAVVLTYDDGTDFHLDNVIPVLDSLNLKATFYIPGNSSSLYKRIDEWRAAAKNGHELGNHTLFHPCHGKSLGRKWVKPDYDLDDYTVVRFINEARVNNTLLKAIDGKDKRTFAYTCGDTTAGKESFVPQIKKMFVAARGTKRGTNTLKNADLYDLKIFSVKNQNADELIEAVKDAQRKGVLLIFLFHGVGGGAPYSISTEEHSRFVHYLKQNENNTWIAPMVEVAEFIKSRQK